MNYCIFNSYRYIIIPAPIYPMMFQKPTDIIYSEHIQTKKGNIFQVSQDFLQYLDSQQSFIITGYLQNDLILPTQQKTYKLKNINLPTSMLIINEKGFIDMEISNFIKLEDYSHQYHKIYLQIKQQAPQENDFDQLTLDELVDKFGLQDSDVKEGFKISLKQFNKFEEFLNFYYQSEKRLFIPKTLMHKFMRNLLMLVTEKQLYNSFFTLEDLAQFNPQIKAFTDVNQQMFNLVAKMFCFEVQNSVEKMQVQGQQLNTPRYKLTFQSIVHFALIELSTTSAQYRATQMDTLLNNMLNIYVPTGMEVPVEQEKKALLKRVTARYFIETTKNNNLIRVFYDPLQIESSLKGRIKFMSSFKSRFTRDQIRGVFEGLVIQDASKEIKQLNQGGRKSIDMDDLLLKNFRRFNDLYEIKLILPK